MSLSTRYRINSPQIVSEIIDGEAVMINLESGNYFSMRGSGSAIWELVVRGACLDEIVSHLVGRYDESPESIRSHAGKLIAELENEDLIVLRDSEAEATCESPAAIGAGAKEAFEMPALEKYTDMQELLMLDPIHDVDHTGWPAVNPDSQDDRT